MIRTDIPTYLIIEILLGAVQAIMNPLKLMELNLTLEHGYSSIIRVIWRERLRASHSGDPMRHGGIGHYPTFSLALALTVGCLEWLQPASL